MTTGGDRTTGWPEPRRELPWYREGLRFTCQPGCVQCCTGPGGFVWVAGNELRSIAEHLGVEEEVLRERHCQLHGTRWSLRERNRDGDCVFLGRRGCRIYPVRPLQCRTYPFWSENLRTREAWEETAQECPGCNRGRLHTLARIQDSMAASSGALARQERLGRALRELYRDVDQEVEALEGRCPRRAHCCGGERTHARRHASTMEVDLMLGQVRPEWSAGRPGRCPYLRGQTCRVWQVRPLGCRVRSCAPVMDRSTRRRLLERYRRRLHQLELAFGVEGSTGRLLRLLSERG